MRILHITSHLNLGGVPSYVISLAHSQRKRGHEVIVAADIGPLQQQLRKFGVGFWPASLHTSAEFSPQVFMAVRALSRGLKQHPVDILHAHTRVGQVAAAWLSRRFHVPYVATWHGFFRQNLGRRLWPCTGERTIAISEPVRKHIIQDFGVSENRVRLVASGIDPEAFAKPLDADAKKKLRQSLGLSAEGPVVGTVSRLVPSKGVEQLIRAFPRIREPIPSAQLLIVGDGPARSSLESFAAGCGVSESVIFAGAMEDIATTLSLMDVFVFLPAKDEGFGLTLLEAMASGRPIVSIRRGGGASWVLEQSRLGSIVEPGDVTTLAGSVVELLQDPAVAKRIGARAAEVVRARFTLDRMTEEVESVYKEVVKDSE